MDVMAESFASNSLLGLNTRTGRCCTELVEPLGKEVMTNLQNEKLQLGDIIWMYPVFGCLTNKVALTATSRAVTLNRVTSRPHNIK
jgi:hypothetical protein